MVSAVSALQTSLDQGTVVRIWMVSAVCAILSLRSAGWEGQKSWISQYSQCTNDSDDSWGAG
eukprot:3594316-Amphidinium_carterae.1